MLNEPHLVTRIRPAVVPDAATNTERRVYTVAGGAVVSTGHSGMFQDRKGTAEYLMGGENMQFRSEFYTTEAGWQEFDLLVFPEPNGERFIVRGIETKTSGFSGEFHHYQMRLEQDEVRPIA